MRKFMVCSGRGPYPVFLGPGLYNRLGSLGLDRGACGRWLIVTDRHVQRYYAGRVTRGFSVGGKRPFVFSLPPGEPSKSWCHLEKLLTLLRQQGFRRDDGIVALGGGMVGDLAGLAAGLYQRGIRWYYLPTSLLAQVDASIGGKVAVNLGAKNNVGMFHPPDAVVTDVAVLATLPDREYRAGMSEVVKAAVIGDPGLFTLLERNDWKALHGNVTLEEELVRRSCLVKKTVVEQDERERHHRMTLNLGHTLAHALEEATGYRRYLHGEAVAIGMVYAARVGRRLGVTSPDLEQNLVEILLSYGLPVAWPGGRKARLLSWMRQDKKARQGGLLLALPEKIGKVRIVPVPEKVLSSCL